MMHRYLKSATIAQSFTRLWEMGRLNLSLEAIAYGRSSRSCSPMRSDKSPRTGWTRRVTPRSSSPSRR